MAPKENSIPTGIVTLWDYLCSSSWHCSSHPRQSHCRVPGKMRHVENPLSVRIGRACSMEGFALNCTFSTRRLQAHVFNVEFMNIPCLWPRRIANTHLNKLTTIGCMTMAYLIVSDTANSSYWSGVYRCAEGEGGLEQWLVHGHRMLPDRHPKGDRVLPSVFDEYLNSSETYNFSRCGYAVLVEEGAFEFRTSYITTGELYKRELPMVIDWAVRNKTCREAQQNKTSYACVSENSTCVDSANGPGYLCNCSRGYQGNPYLPHVCKQGWVSMLWGLSQYTRWILVLMPRGTHGDPYKGTCYSKLPQAAKLVIGICISLLIILIIMLCIHIILERRKLIKVKEENFQQHGGWLLLEEIRNRQGLAFKMFTEKELEQATNKFHKNNIIGHGSYGTVYKGILKDNRVVAIKRAKIINERQKKEFGKEMLILSQVNHRNIVKLLGCCLEVEVPMLVYEYISNGNLFQLIHGNGRRIYISLETRLKIALESAEALAYLHSSASPPIIHGDVKSANILLDDHLMAKVSDFGASMLAPRDETQFVTLVQGTCGYLDPEYLQTCLLIDKSDVYSFGVVLLELLTSKKALRFEGTEREMSLSSSFLSAMKEGRFSELLDDQIKYDEDVERINEIAVLAKACLNVKGEDRPSMKEVAEELDRLKKMKQHTWEQHNHAEIESLLDNLSSYREEENTGFYSLEKKAMLSIEPGR
uniref:Protein kinase domain-containing protein n=1 Tax=Ananas comosus var. bracteatus TaxID=296719 RepID=A0A6V7QLJ0_ANACO|nr:unnamed protein product [Ananas comosus var. bracteatus]